MISVEEAKALVIKNITALPPVTIPLSEAAGHVLAADIFAICDIPAFRQSSMDGYALRYSDKNVALPIKGEMYAGVPEPFTIEPGEACRIFTGGPLPEGADTVVMQENVSVSDGRLKIVSDGLNPGDNVRKKGAEIRSGELAMQKGTYLTPAAIGFLAGTGICEVSVYPSPKVAVILTGKELQQPGHPLAFGQVYDSNSYSLSAALKLVGVKTIIYYYVDDNLMELKDTLAKAITDNDMVLLTGGVSVGDYDFVVKAADLCGVAQIFHKVKQKPGKPLYFGKMNDKVIFGLPGNPSSVLSCFYNYVSLAIAGLSQQPDKVKFLTATLGHAIKKPAGLTHFLKGTYTDGVAASLGAQESFRLSSFAHANCLIRLAESQDSFAQGDAVSVLLLPE
ncbi:molybdopterin molybdotransferase MoeA [Mucilaginibacter sp. 21P]|uniref:molybdopterin molybdotransferase MoeA n=1 Tax=Mucilaginibacter sp. 21P TaxID=2778902 RepID=UPI001C58CFCC|nr:gephyrin-like molybdotransferase Glp [Mucilaginibacter sp. 21P]QXV65955.1 molybdopterin molybdotransferase MoeA [Mucilaginibacter sp. 21P]